MVGGDVACFARRLEAGIFEFQGYLDGFIGPLDFRCGGGADRLADAEANSVLAALWAEGERWFELRAGQVELPVDLARDVTAGDALGRLVERALFLLG